MTAGTNALAVTLAIDATPEVVWHCMTDRIAEWWCPAPWRLEVVEIDWRAGGRVAFDMLGPDGERVSSDGVFLEVEPRRKFVSTDAYLVGWIPAEPFMTGEWAIEPHGSGTRYRASARHWTKAACEQHRAMGFEDGWMQCAQQLKALAEGLARTPS